MYLQCYSWWREGCGHTWDKGMKYSSLRHQGVGDFSGKSPVLSTGGRSEWTRVSSPHGVMERTQEIESGDLGLNPEPSTECGLLKSPVTTEVERRGVSHRAQVITQIMTPDRFSPLCAASLFITTANSSMEFTFYETQIFLLNSHRTSWASTALAPVKSKKTVSKWLTWTSEWSNYDLPAGFRTPHPVFFPPMAYLEPWPSTVALLPVNRKPAPASSGSVFSCSLGRALFPGLGRMGEGIL